MLYCIVPCITRRQVELFCIDHLVMVTVEATDEFLYLDLAFPTTKLHARGMDGGDGEGVDSGLNGMEAAFQVVGNPNILIVCRLMDGHDYIHYNGLLRG